MTNPTGPAPAMRTSFAIGLPTDRYHRARLAAKLAVNQAVDDRRDQAMDLFAAFGEYQVAFFVGVIDVALFACERTQGEHRTFAGAGEALDQLARLLLGHRDDEVGLLKHFGMPLEVV